MLEDSVCRCPSGLCTFGGGGASEGFGTGGVGHGVRQRLLRVAAVVVDLEQDGDVHEDLQQPADPELDGRLGEQEVDGLEGVAAGPHQNHLDAGGRRKDEEEPDGEICASNLTSKHFETHVNERFPVTIKLFGSFSTWLTHVLAD